MHKQSSAVAASILVNSQITLVFNTEARFRNFEEGAAFSVSVSRLLTLLSVAAITIAAMTNKAANFFNPSGVLAEALVVI